MVAECKFCKMQYVGQTKNKFSTRWNNHRSFWNKININDNNNRAAFLKNFYEFCFDDFNAKSDITAVVLKLFAPAAHLDQSADFLVCTEFSTFSFT